MSRFNAPPAAERPADEEASRRRGSHTEQREGQSTVTARGACAPRRLTPCPRHRVRIAVQRRSDRCRGRCGAQGPPSSRPEGVSMSARKYKLVTSSRPTRPNEQVTAVHAQVQATSRASAARWRRPTTGAGGSWPTKSAPQGRHLRPRGHRGRRRADEGDRSAAEGRHRQVIRHLIVRVDEEERVVTARGQRQHRSQQHRRRMARGLPPSAGRRERPRQDDRDDGGFDGAGV